MYVFGQFEQCSFDKQAFEVIIHVSDNDVFNLPSARDVSAIHLAFYIEKFLLFFLSGRFEPLSCGMTEIKYTKRYGEPTRIRFLERLGRAKSFL